MTKPKAEPDRIVENIQRREPSPGVKRACQILCPTSGRFSLPSRWDW